jgi:hypothetical protein
MRISSVILANIKNIANPICIECVHFIKHVPYNKDTQRNNIYGKCRQFGNKDLVTGEIVYELASTTRREINRCKSEGIYFIPINREFILSSD